MRRGPTPSAADRGQTPVPEPKRAQEIVEGPGPPGEGSPDPTPEREALPVIRVRLAARNSEEFLTLARVIARNGVSVVPSKLLAIGSHLRVKLELSAGGVVATADAVVAKHVAVGTRAGMTLRLVALDADSVQFPLVPPNDGPRPPAAELARLDDWSDLLLHLREPRSERQASSRTAFAMAPKFSEAQLWGRRARGRSLALVVPLVIAGMVTGFAVGSGYRSGSVLAAESPRDDERSASGSLASPDGEGSPAPLPAAEAFAEDDSRLQERLRALADKFEQLGDQALSRGDTSEAAAHYQGAVLFDPGRTRAAQRLVGIEQRLRCGPRSDPVAIQDSRRLPQGR